MIPEENSSLYFVSGMEHLPHSGTFTEAHQEGDLTGLLDSEISDSEVMSFVFPFVSEEFSAEDTDLAEHGAPAEDGQERGNWTDEPADGVLWHMQHHDDTCAIVSQEFVLESITGQNFSEDQLREEAIENGWYAPGAGTPIEHVGDLLSAHGIPLERGFHNSVSDLEERLKCGDKVIVGVHAEDIWFPQTPTLLESLLSDIGFMPGQAANHAVQVVSVDRSDSSNPIVVLNDSGTPNGAGERVPMDTFERAWSASDHFMVNTLLP